MEDLLQELDVYRRQILEGVSAEEIDRKQKELGVAFPEGMKVFYSRLAYDEDVMNSYYKLYPLSDVRIEDDALVFGENHQGVNKLGITLKHLNSPYQSMSFYDFETKKWYSNGFMFPESFFFNVSCWQLVNSMKSVAKLSISYEELQKVMCDRLSYFTDNPKYLRSSRIVSVHREKVLGSYFMEDEELYVGTRFGDDVLNDFEEEFNVDLDWL